MNIEKAVEDVKETIADGVTVVKDVENVVEHVKAGELSEAVKDAATTVHDAEAVVTDVENVAHDI